MSKEYPCVYYDNEKCKKFSTNGVTSYCVQGPCEDETPSNADRIRAMTDEELAEFLVHFSNGVKRWLQQPAGGADQ